MKIAFGSSHTKKKGNERDYVYSIQEKTNTNSTQQKNG